MYKYNFHFDQTANKSDLKIVKLFFTKMQL